MNPLKNIKQVCLFIGLLNHYRDMWSIRWCLLQPLTTLTSEKVAFKLTDVEQNSFDYIKRVVARDTLLSYPYFNDQFDKHTDASYHLSDSFIRQDRKTIAFYIHKLTET